MQAPKTWHYLPELPIQVSPYFNWPPNRAAGDYALVCSWLGQPFRKINHPVDIAIACWLFWHPSLAETSELSFDWIAQIYLRNLVLLTLVAGGLHAYFYTWRKQGDELRFDSRPLVANSRVFTFNSQVYDNIFWSCMSGVTVWTAYEVLMLWLLANGHIPALDLQQDWPLFVLLIAFLPIWETFHFFVIHRLIHWPPFYRRIHALHHRNTNTGPEVRLLHAPGRAPALPVNRTHSFYCAISSAVIDFSPAVFCPVSCNHTHGIPGFDAGWQTGVTPRVTFHHRLHHRFFECNYGGLEIPMDKWTGSFHDGTEEPHQAFSQASAKRWCRLVKDYG